ncbi:hypothetical protein [Bombilactobacillus bombi]|uniref:hypothetical protein n=1 Tax=Bombilactobacillus bombi TaxID=1303590 RepID=UPI0015E5FA6F|nr:hypothetical protein [Bombilactobacillus bombi]MBA1433896.1 hypothetical protein [Bombilactobacillus bombi]
MIILSNGKNVSPELLKQKIMKNPLIQACVVYEKKDSIYVKMYIEVDNNYEDNKKSVCQFINSLNYQLPSFERIANVIIVNKDFQRTASGKIVRK